MTNQVATEVNQAAEKKVRKQRADKGKTRGPRKTKEVKQVS